MPILNYTTTVAVDRTVLKIQKKLAGFGASQISIDYDDVGAVALAFRLSIVLQDGTAQLVDFRLPADFEGVAAAIKKAKVERRYQTPEHVRKVAWRIVEDWLSAQLAILEARIARPEQLLLAFAVAADGRTVYEHFADSPQYLLAQ